MLTGRFLNVSLLGREVLQARCLIHRSVLLSLNPFEVREVSQACAIFSAAVACCLNPFEVREVLQGQEILETVNRMESQSL